MLSEGIVIGLTAAWHTERLCASSLSPSAASVIEAMRVRFKKPTVFQKWKMANTNTLGGGVSKDTRCLRATKPLFVPRIQTGSTVQYGICS